MPIRLFMLLYLACYLRWFWQTPWFTVSLVFRTVDNQVCGGFPLGTHFVWHLLNGVLLFLLGHAATRRWQDLAAADSRTIQAREPADTDA